MRVSATDMLLDPERQEQPEPSRRRDRQPSNPGRLPFSGSWSAWLAAPPTRTGLVRLSETATQEIPSLLERLGMISSLPPPGRTRRSTSTLRCRHRVRSAPGPCLSLSLPPARRPLIHETVARRPAGPLLGPGPYAPCPGRCGHATPCACVPLGCTGCREYKDAAFPARAHPVLDPLTRSPCPFPLFHSLSRRRAPLPETPGRRHHGRREASPCGREGRQR